MTGVRRHGPPSGSVVGDDELWSSAVDALGPGVTAVERALSRYATSATIEDVRVHRADRSVVDLVLKDLSPEAMLSGARSFKPRFLVEPGRELAAYRDLLPHAGGFAATCVAAREQGRRRWLLLEKVPGVELYQVGEVELWAAAAGAVARMHTALTAAVGGSERAPGWLLRQDGSYLRRWMERALAHEAERGGGRLPALRAVARVHGGAVEELARLPVGVLHGDLYASNVLVTPGDLLRVCPVDWEYAGLGPATLDVAALTSGGWTAQEREAMSRAYWEELDDRRWSPSWAEWELSLDMARLQVCVQWLGWSAGWTPPTEHTQDWLAEARRIADRLAV